MADKRKETPQEFLINDKVIDVTGFTRRHPGGGVIRFMLGTNATDTYNAFHLRSKKADAILKALPCRIATKEDRERFLCADSEAVLRDFEEFRQQLKAEGFYDPAYLHIAYRVVEIILLHFAGMAMLFRAFDSSNLGTACAILILGIAQGRCGWFMHEGGHCSLTGNMSLDRTIQRFFYGYGCGMSGRWWRIQHNKHHTAPQKLNHDADLDTLPLVAFCREMAEKASDPFSKFFVYFQNWLFVPVTCLLVSLGWQLFLHPRCILRKKEWVEAVWLAARYATLAYLNHFHFGWGYGTFLYLAYMWVGSVYMFVNFAVSHTHLPVVAKNVHVDWVAYASFYTMNVSHTWWCDWWMCYLNYQIEHHLFPSMPQYRFPEIAPRVRKLFKKHGYPYQYDNYFSALRTTFSNLEAVGHAIG